MLHHATAGSLLGISLTLWFVLLTIAAAAGVVWSLGRKISLLAAGRHGVAATLDRLEGVLKEKGITRVARWDHAGAASGAGQLPALYRR